MAGVAPTSSRQAKAKCSRRRKPADWSGGSAGSAALRRRLQHRPGDPLQKWDAPGRSV